MPNNLARPRPDEWQRGDLFPFIEEAWSNSVGIVGNSNVVAARLTAIDEIFFAVHNGLKPANEAQLVPTLLLLRSFSAFRAAVMVGLSMPTDSFPVQRSCLEYAGYAKLVMVGPELAKLCRSAKEIQQSCRAGVHRKGRCQFGQDISGLIRAEHRFRRTSERKGRPRQCRAGFAEHGQHASLDAAGRQFAAAARAQELRPHRYLQLEDIQSRI
jgi:hypothetical protein